MDCVGCELLTHSQPLILIYSSLCMISTVVTPQKDCASS